MGTKIAVVGGGTGFIGKHICKALENKGYYVKVISRSSKDESSLTWDTVEKMGLPSGTTAVFNLAGEPVLNPLKRWSTSLEKEIYESRVKTTSLLRKVICESPEKPQFWGSCSGIGYYPPNKNLQYDEDFSVDTKDQDYWSKLTVQWEDAAKLPEGEDQIRHVTMRTAVVLGRGGGALSNMLPPFYMGLGGPIGSGEQWFPWIHLDDVVNFWMYALENESTRGVYNGISPQKVTNAQFATTLGSVLRRPAIIPLPAFVVNTMFGKVRASMLLEGQTVYPKRIIQSGYKFKHNDIHSALQASV